MNKWEWNGNGGNGGNDKGNGQSGGESYLTDVRKMPGGGYGVYADVFKGKRVMTPGGKQGKN